MTQLAVVAVGGNSLIKDEKHKTVHDQYEAACASMRHIADLIQAGWNVVVTHGNGPQVGFILRRSELSRHELHDVPLDSCGADTQGAIGYMFQKALRNEFKTRGLANQAVTVVTQVLVDQNDPAFQKPSKPIGSFMSEADAREKMAAEHWAMVEDAGRGWRRVVASPKPQAIVERDAIETLIKTGFTVIAVGGGGIPVYRQGNHLKGASAVVDKDLASAKLAELIDADVLIILTAVERVALNFGKPDQRWLDRMTVDEARRYIQEGHFAKGSMLPKVQAAVDFAASRPGRSTLITLLAKAKDGIEGRTGTRIG